MSEEAAIVPEENEKSASAEEVSEQEKKLQENYNRLIIALAEIKGKLLSHEVDISLLKHKEDSIVIELTHLFKKVKADAEKNERKKA